MDVPYILARRYRLDRLIGAGRDADTYLATDLALARPVVVNVWRAPMDGDAQATVRFAGEIHSAAAVDHPQVVRVLDAGSDGTTRFIVMEAVLGSSLKARIEAGVPLPLDQALGWTTQILGGLAAIHDAGLIHGDLTPENVLVDANGRVKLTGFGIAHPATGVGRSAAYLAPEQARGEPLTPATDIFAVGIILFELLTGRLPVIADHPLGVRYQQVNQPPPSVRAVNPAVSAVLDSIVARALAPDPRQRYPSARAMQDALDAVAAAQEIRVPPASRRESPRLAAARRVTARFLVTAAAVVLLLLTSLVVLALRGSEPGADPTAGPALASSQLVDPQPHRSALAPATPTPTATATNLVPPPIHRVVPVVPTPTAPAHPAAPPKATAVSTPIPTPAPAPQPTPIVEPRPTLVPLAVPVTTPAARTGTAAVSPRAAAPTATVAPTPSPSPTARPAPTPAPSPSPSPTASPPSTPTPTPTPDPRPTPTPAPSPTPTPAPTPEPTPPPSPTPTPTPKPSPTPVPAP